MAKKRKSEATDQHPEAAFVWLFLGLFLMAPTVPWPFIHLPNRLYQTHEFFPPAEALVFSTLTLFSFLFCLRAGVRWLRMVHVQPLDILLCTFIMWTGISSIWSD